MTWAANRTHHLRTICLFAVWWGSNTAYAVGAQRLLRHSEHPGLFVDLSVVQVGLGLLLSYSYVVISRLRHKEVLSTEEVNISLRIISEESNSLVLLVAGLFNFLGTVATNASYLLLGSTSTFIWKLTEPFSVIFLKFLLMGQVTSLSSIIGVLHIVVGVLVSSEIQRTTSSLLVVLVSNVSYPIRNVTFKLHQANSHVHYSGVESFYLLQLMTLPFMVLSYVAKCIVCGVSSSHLFSLFCNSFLYVAYQFASMALLQVLDPLTHAIGNTFKRFFGIILSTIATKEAFSATRARGFMLSALGFVLYVTGSPSLNVESTLKRRIHYVCGAISVTNVIDTFSRHKQYTDMFMRQFLGHEQDV